MGNFEKAFKPFDWQTSIVGITEEAYKTHLEAVFNTYLDCGTDAGKEAFDKCISQVVNFEFFGKNLVDLLKANTDKIKMVRDTDLLIGYVMVDQLKGSIKYYIDYRMADKLKKKNKAPRTAEEVFNFFVKTVGFVPVKYNRASLKDLDSRISYKFETIKRIMDEGDNTDLWSNAMKIQLLAGFSHLRYLPNDVKYYFVLQGKKQGCYLKADTERNNFIKQKHLESIQKDAEVAEEGTDVVEEVTTTEVEEA